MQKTMLWTLLVALVVGLAAKTVLAAGTPSNGGAAGLMVAIVMGEDVDSKKDSAKAPSTSTLEGEFAALNSQPETLKLIGQSAGGSVALKALMK